MIGRSIHSLKRVFRRLAHIAWPHLVPPALGLDQHIKGGVYENFGVTVFKGTREAVDYDRVGLIVLQGRYHVGDYTSEHIMATLQAKSGNPIYPGDEVVIYQGSDDRFWIRAKEEYNQKFTRLEIYP